MALQKRFQKQERVQKGYDTPFLKPSPTARTKRTSKFGLSLIYNSTRGNNEERLTEQGEETGQWSSRMTEITRSPRVSSPFNSPPQSEGDETVYLSLLSSSTGKTFTLENQVDYRANIIPENQGFLETPSNQRVPPENPLFDLAVDRQDISGRERVLPRNNQTPVIPGSRRLNTEYLLGRETGEEAGPSNFLNTSESNAAVPRTVIMSPHDYPPNERTTVSPNAQMDVVASISRGRFLNLGGSRLIVSIIGGIGFKGSFSPNFKFGFNVASDFGVSPLEPKQIQGWGRNNVLRVDVDKHSFSYEWGSIYPKDNIAEKGLRPFNEITRGFGPLEVKGKKVRFSRLGFNTPFQFFGIEEFCSHAKIQFTFHRNDSFFPFKGLKGTQAIISFLYEPKVGEWEPKIFGWKAPFEFTFGGTNKLSFCDDNNIKLLRGLSQLNQNPAPPGMGSNFQQNIFCAPDQGALLKDISQRQVAFEEQMVENQSLA